MARLLLQTSLEVFVAAHPVYPDFETQQETIRADFTFLSHESDPACTHRMAEVLERMYQNDDISQWLYVPRNTTLDQLKVDFVIKEIPEDRSAFVPIQVASTAKNAQVHRRHIRRLYGLDYDGFIPVVRLLDPNGNLVTYETARGLVIQAMLDFEKATT